MLARSLATVALVLSLSCGGAPPGPAPAFEPGPAGPILIVSDRGGAWRIYEVTAGGVARLIGSPEASETSYQDGMPARLADGRVVFVTDRDGAPALYVTAPGSRSATRLLGVVPEGPVADTSPAPLGRDRIIFARSSRSGNTWSPRDLYSVGVDGSGVRRLTDNPADDDRPSGAADGRTAVFVSNRTGAPHLFLLPNLQGADPDSEAIDLSIAAPPEAAAYADGSPLLLADGSVIFSRTLRGGTPQLFVLGTTGARIAARQLTDPVTLRYGADEPVSGADRSILFVTGPPAGTGPHAVYQIDPGGFNLARMTRDQARYSDFTRRLGAPTPSR